ncbi:hypothetical protein T05_4354 [Trichinella murrelli]|uniref:Uncharacterized protein n=1 Tax=Trichinella murrelli TaxID=144512 RepID=A0A0V0T2W1_9BILA|nr:hypothetical protein T05_4354 [Trichinella murrelli]
MDCWRHVRFWVPGVTLSPLEKHFYVAEKMQQSNLRNSADLRLFWNGRLIMAIFTKEMIIILVEENDFNKCASNSLPYTVQEEEKDE